MAKFTELYTKAREVVGAQKFEATEWEPFLNTTIGMKSLFGVNGFGAGNAPDLDKLRSKVEDKSKAVAPATLAAYGGKAGEAIYNAAQNGTSPGKWQERAAVLELALHLHRATEVGGAGVWVYSPLVGHAKPVFDELNGTDAEAKKKLGLSEEIFDKGDRDLMADALAVSRKVIGDTIVKLSAKHATTLAMVKTWFGDSTTTDAEILTAVTTLHDGFKKMAVSCTATTLVFTDYIDWRAARANYFGAAFRGGEGGGFPVVYLEGAFTALKGNSGKLWLAAETIIHELSHHDAMTQDHRYDSSGLKPSSNAFPHARAIENADSWGYFALDLAGYLSAADKLTYYK